MRHARSAVRLRLCGAASDPNYLTELYALVQKLGLAGRVMIEPRWISEQEKADRLASSLAVAYVPFDEDSYGYPTLEAAQARRAILTASDSGGVLEFVRDGVEGLVVRPQPDALAAAFDRLHEDRGLAGRLGAAAAARVRQLGIDWDSVIDKLLA
jgi:glycosyltransferase involved in cell wall biosynthesis